LKQKLPNVELMAQDSSITDQLKIVDGPDLSAQFARIAGECLRFVWAPRKQLTFCSARFPAEPRRSGCGWQDASAAGRD